MINNSDIVLSSTVSVHNEHGNKVVVFTYPWCEVGGSIDLELCFVKWFDKCFWNDQEFMVALL